MEDFSKAALLRFVETVAQQGLVNISTANGWRAACNRILEDIDDGHDVRSVDVPMAVKRYNNRHPGQMLPSSLKEYERRLAIVIREFAAYVIDPAGYKPRGKSPAKSSNGKSSGAERTTSKRKPKEGAEATPITPEPASAPRVEHHYGLKPTVIHGLSLEFPMRPDFLAQVVVPRDMKADEARRFTRFIMTLAQDFEPPEG